MFYDDDFFDRITAEIPEINIGDHETFIVTTPTGSYIVPVQILENWNKINTFAPVVIYNDIVEFPYKVDFVADSREDVENFLTEYRIPFSEVLIQKHKL